MSQLKWGIPRVNFSCFRNLFEQRRHFEQLLKSNIIGSAPYRVAAVCRDRGKDTRRIMLTVCDIYGGNGVLKYETDTHPQWLPGA